MPDYETIEYERKGRIVYIRLNRPEVLNARNETMHMELNDAWAEFDEDDEAFVAILSGNGRAFCSGADVRRLAAPRSESRPAARRGGFGELGVPTNTRNWKPVIAAIHGYAYGGGYWLQATADLVVAAEGTLLQITEIRRGIAAGNFWVSARFYTGSKFANDIAVTGRSFTAEEAFEQGMINRLVPQEKLIETAEELANEILKNPPLSVRATIRSIRRLPQELARDSMLYQESLKLQQTEDYKEAALSFLEKREPVYRGR